MLLPSSKERRLDYRSVAREEAAPQQFTMSNDAPTILSSFFLLRNPTCILLITSVNKPTEIHIDLQEPFLHTDTLFDNKDKLHVEMSSVPPESPPHHTPTRIRATTRASQTMPPPTFGSISQSITPPYLSSFFGVEFELLIRPLPIVTQSFPVPDTDASIRKLRDYSLQLRTVMAQILSAHGMPCNVFEDEDKPDYTKWDAMLDGSISKKHEKDGFCKLSHPVQC